MGSDKEQDISYKALIWRLEKEVKITERKLALWRAIDELFCFAYEADHNETMVSRKQYNEGYITLSEYLTMLDDIAQQKDNPPNMKYIYYLYATYLERDSLK